MRNFRPPEMTRLRPALTVSSRIRACARDQRIWSHAWTMREAAESMLGTDRMLACFLLRGFGICSRHSIPRGSLRPFRVEHVVSYPGRLQPSVCFLRDPMPAVPSPALQLADPCGPSAVCLELQTIHPSACRFGSGAYSYFRLSLMTIVTAVCLGSPDHRA